MNNPKNLIMKKILPNLNVMKRIIPVVTMAVVFAACNSKPDTTAPQTAPNATVMNAEDSLVLSQFRAWKSQNELSDAREFLNGGQYNSTSQNTANSSSKTTSTARRTSSSGSSGSRTASSSSGTSSKPKGWSGAAKGAVIGGVAGAAGGAVINKKNRAIGAVIGGVLGAGAGYGIGRGMDKKDGRIE